MSLKSISQADWFFKVQLFRTVIPNSMCHSRWFLFPAFITGPKMQSIVNQLWFASPNLQVFFLLGQLNWQAVINCSPNHGALLTKILQEVVFWNDKTQPSFLPVVSPSSILRRLYLAPCQFFLQASLSGFHLPPNTAWSVATYFDQEVPFLKKSRIN